MTLCCCWPCSIFEALPCRMSCCQLCNQKCINQWPAEPFADFLVMASRHDLGWVLQYGCDTQRKLRFLKGDGNLARPYIPTLDARFTLCLGRWLVRHGLEQGLLAPRPPL